MDFQAVFAVTSILILSISNWMCSCLKLTSTTVPYYAVLHREDSLYCHFDLENDTLFALKWYKDGHEFFRFKPRDNPPITIFPLLGVTVSENRSSLHQVTLERITKESKGDYRCEISADAPHFQTLDEEKFMRIMVLPLNGPKITGIYPWYNVGDNLTAQCNYSQSFPESKLAWFINNEEIDARECRCVTFESFPSDDESSNSGASLYSSTSEIKFPIDTNYLRDGTVSIECRATFSRSSVLVQSQVVTNVKSGLGLQFAMHSGTSRTKIVQISILLGIVAFSAMCVMPLFTNS